MSIFSLFQFDSGGYEVWCWSDFQGKLVKDSSHGDKREAFRVARRRKGKVVDHGRSDRTIYESPGYKRKWGSGGGKGDPHSSGHKTWRPSLERLDSRDLYAELEQRGELEMEGDEVEGWEDEW